MTDTLGATHGCTEDGTGRGTPLTLAIRGRAGESTLEWSSDGVANAILTPNGGRGGIGVGAVAFNARQDPISGPISGPIDTDGSTQAVAYGLRSDAGREGTAKTPSPDAKGRLTLRDPGFNVYKELALTIDAGQPHTVAFAQNQRDEVRTMDVAGALAKESGMKQQTYVNQAMSVRRLTPRECERLQGFPDDYTLIQRKGKLAADGPRYKALGNSMAVPVMAWIGKRIARCSALSDEGSDDTEVKHGS